MRIGLAFTLKPDGPLPAGAPDDLHEEFDSPATVRGLAEALRSHGHEVIELGDGVPLLNALIADPPDLVFNIAEGSGTSRNRESRVPAVCEMLGIRCTGSDALTLGLALDKDMARRIVADAGVAVPRGFAMPLPKAAYTGDFAEFPALLAIHGLELPVIAKPVCEGSSKGIRSKCLIERPDDLGPAIAELWANYRQAVLVEEFIAGEEVTVGLVGNDPTDVLGAMRVVPKTPTDRFVYSLEVKRNWEDMVSYECPPEMPYAVLRAIDEAALTSFHALGCRDLARIDFRIRDGIPYFIEANPLPGLNPITSDLVLISKALEIPYEELIGRIVVAAMGR